MRKLILQMQCTLDGFISGPNRDLKWIFPDFDKCWENWAEDALWQAGAHLMGRVTYHDMAAHWPSSKEPYAPPMNQIPKIVFSRTLKCAQWQDTEILAGDLATEIARLKREPGKELLAHGGVTFARSLVATGLIDEYRLVVHPIALGQGASLFAKLAAPMRSRLVKSVPFKTGLTVNVFQPA
jgi:dihydrofolate reductase